MLFDGFELSLQFSEEFDISLSSQPATDQPPK
jgi:hypothetical protein